VWEGFFYYFGFLPSYNTYRTNRSLIIFYPLRVKDYVILNMINSVAEISKILFAVSRVLKDHSKSSIRIYGWLCGPAVACWITDHYHPCSNLGMGISEGCFILDFASLPLEVSRPI